MPELIRSLARLLPPAKRQTISRAAAAEQEKLVIQGGALLPSHYSGQPLWSTWNLEQAIENGFKDSALVYVASSAAALASSSVPWRAEVLESGQWVPEPDHPAAQLLAMPNFRTSGQQMIERLGLHLNLSGNGLVRKILVNRTLPGALAPVVTELQNIQPQGISPILDREKWVSAYEFRMGGIVHKFPAEEIIHFMLPDPGNQFWGLSPLEAMSKTVDTEREATAWNMTSMQNRAVSDGVFASRDPMTTEQWNRYREMIFEQHQGSAHAHEPWVLGGGFDWKEMGRTPVEMDFIASLKFYREMILSGYHVPPVMAGFFDQATLANAEVSRRLWWVDFVVPFLHRMADVWRFGLVPHFGDPKTLRLVPDLSDVDALRDNVLEQSKIFTVLVKNGVPYNEASEKSGLDLEAQPEGDVPFGVTIQTSTVEAVAGAQEAAAAAGALERKQEEIDIPGSATGLAIMRLQPEHLRAIQKRFEDETAAHREEGVELARIEAALVAMDYDSVMAGLDMTGYRDRLEDLAEEIGAAAIAGALLGSASLLEQAGIEVDTPSALTQAWVRNRAGALATGMVETSIKGVRKVFEAWRSGALGDSARRVAKMLLSTFSLAERDAGAVAKFAEAMLERSTLSQAEIGRRAARLAAGYEQARAAGVGGQEATLALNQGQRAVWKDAVAKGQIYAAQKTWLDDGGPNRCPICISLHLQTVPQEDNYIAPYDGQEYGGPGDPHNRCNCGEAYEVVAVAA
jgi:HK97 family phage portal protein